MHLPCQRRTSDVLPNERTVFPSETRKISTAAVAAAFPTVEAQDGGTRGQGQWVTAPLPGRPPCFGKTRAGRRRAKSPRWPSAVRTTEGVQPRQAGKARYIIDRGRREEWAIHLP